MYTCLQLNFNWLHLTKASQQQKGKVMKEGRKEGRKWVERKDLII
jgi:hypothetical protein